MSLLEGFVGAWQYFLNPLYLLAVIAGVVIGLVLGVVPGISALTGIVLILPFLYLIRPDVALAFMVSMVAVSVIGGSILAILLGIPGDPGNAASILDGFPLTRKGKAVSTISVSLTCSILGCTLSTIFALILVSIILPIIMAIHSAELVIFVLLGLSFLAGLSRGGAIKGLISGALGLSLAFVGSQATTAVPRFTFGSMYLYDGLPLAVIALSLFAIPEMLELAAGGQSIATEGGKFNYNFPEVMKGIRETLRHWWLVVRCSFIGFFVGVMPGAGSSIAAFMAYAHAKQTSKHPETFGTGQIEGVLGSESAVVAEHAGAALTSLALGIPGSGIWALILGGFLMIGLTPGPGMLRDHLPLALNLIYLFAVGGIIGSLICFVAVPYLGRLAIAPAHIMFPTVMVFVLIGAFANRELMADVIFLLVFSVVGVGLKRFDYNRPSFILGFVLGALFEKYFFLAVMTDGWLFFLRPISLALLFCTILPFILGPIRRVVSRKTGRQA